MRGLAFTVVVLVATLVGSCAIDLDAPAELRAGSQEIIYGDDDRMDLYAVDGVLARVARASAVALLPPEVLQAREDGSYLVVAPSYEEVQSLCPDERFSAQIAAASCSGVLVAPDLVATTGHCLTVTVEGRPDCARYRYVLGFAVTEPSAPIAIAAHDVFECSEVLARAKTNPEAVCQFDLALVRLDRAAINPVSRRSRPVETGESLAVIGFPAGLPVKIDRGAWVIDPRSNRGDFFTLNSDTFAVSSGSGVFDLDGKLVGLFSRGRRDYDQHGSCWRVHREDESSAPGFEEATHVMAIEEVVALLEGSQEATFAADQLCHVSKYLQHQITASESDTAEMRMSTGSRTQHGCSVAGVGAETNFALIVIAGNAFCLVARRRQRH